MYACESERGVLLAASGLFRQQRDSITAEECREEDEASLNCTPAHTACSRNAWRAGRDSIYPGWSHAQAVPNHPHPPPGDISFTACQGESRSQHTLWFFSLTRLFIVNTDLKTRGGCSVVSWCSHFSVFKNTPKCVKMGMFNTFSVFWGKESQTFNLFCVFIHLFYFLVQTKSTFFGGYFF